MPQSSVIRSLAFSTGPDCWGYKLLSNSPLGGSTQLASYPWNLLRQRRRLGGW